MYTYYEWLNSLVNNCKSDFAKWPEINWLNPYKTDDFQKTRDRLIFNVQKNTLFKETKPFYKQISKGCSICGEGKWSCLFITGKCNAKCFYCPASQLKDEAPSSQGMDFDSPEAYADYVNFMGFKGVGFSGGEPLLYFDRTLAYLKEIRKKCRQDIYIWMYTNGLLGDENKLKQLADVGLNEIRFDIGATDFSLDKVKKAKNIIPVITIEIPAIPEEKERLINLLPEMIDAGVTNLNLHQLRLTAFNVDKFTKRNYTIALAERPIVVESELTALEILDHAKINKLDIGINYCSFYFKNRFQKAGYRSIIAKKFTLDSKITENGYIREQSGNSITYSVNRFFDSKPNFTQTKMINVNDKEYYLTDNIVFQKEELTDEAQKRIAQVIKVRPFEIPTDPLLFKVWQLEYIESGLRAF